MASSGNSSTPTSQTSSSQGSNTQSPTSTTTTLPRAASPFQQPNEKGPGECKAQQIFPRMELLLPGEPVAVDFEFQTYRRQGEVKNGHRLGWIAAVNTKGESILECCPRYEKEDAVRIMMPPKRFGVTHASVQINNGAIPAAFAEEWLAQIIRGRTVVVHGGSNGDRTACKIVDPFEQAKAIVDTQGLYGTIKLETLMAQTFPTATPIQVGGRHTPVEDAQATMKLYLHRIPYDRNAEKLALERNGQATFCKPPVEQTQQVQEMRRRHEKAVRLFRTNARGESHPSRGGQSACRGRGRGRGRGN